MQVKPLPTSPDPNLVNLDYCLSKYLLEQAHSLAIDYCHTLRMHTHPTKCVMCR